MQIMSQVSHKLLSLLAIIILYCTTGCSSDSGVFSDSASKRIQARQDSLQQVLTTAPNGWEAIYFPQTDSLLFSDLKTELDIHKFPNQLGYGGFYFQLKFSPNGSLMMRGDYTDDSALENQNVHYELGHNSMTRLSFSTGNYLTKLIGDKYQGELDFLFQGTDADGRLIFVSPRSIRPAKAYLILKRIGENQNDERLQQASKHRKTFENMRNPRLKIQQGSRTYFSSDHIIKYSTRGELTSYGINQVAQRYALFTQVSRKANVPDGPPQGIIGLGSGYVGTPDGLTFLSGIRLDDKNIFRDFIFRNGVYECELVRVYDPLYRTTRLESKHLHPEGEETGIIATIYDDPNAKYKYY